MATTADVELLNARLAGVTTDINTARAAATPAQQCARL